jgi:hypothetical protein
MAPRLSPPRDGTAVGYVRNVDAGLWRRLREESIFRELTLAKLMNEILYDRYKSERKPKGISNL